MLEKSDKYNCPSCSCPNDADALVCSLCSYLLQKEERPFLVKENRHAMETAAPHGPAGTATERPVGLTNDYIRVSHLLGWSLESVAGLMFLVSLLLPPAEILWGWWSVKGEG